MKFSKMYTLGMKRKKAICSRLTSNQTIFFAVEQNRFVNKYLTHKYKKNIISTCGLVHTIYNSPGKSRKKNEVNQQGFSARTKFCIQFIYIKKKSIKLLG